MDRSPWQDRLFRTLLRLFPAEFRQEFGDAMREDFRDQRAAAGRPRSAARVWYRTTLDFVGRAPREHFDILARDLRYAARLLRRRPTLAATAILTLAVAIGLNTAVFSVVHGVLLRALPLPDEQRLVRVYTIGPPPEHEIGAVSRPNFTDYAARAHTLDAAVLVTPSDPTLTSAGDPERIAAMTVSEHFFSMFHGRPALGRLPTPDDYAPLAGRAAPQVLVLSPSAWREIRPPAAAARSASPPAVQPAGGAGTSGDGRPATPHPPAASVAPPPRPLRIAVLSYDFWQRKFGGRADVIGTVLRFGDSFVGDAAEIVGVASADFSFARSFNDVAVDCWLPEQPSTQMRNVGYANDIVLGRLVPGITVAGAQAELSAIAADLARAYPTANADKGVRVLPLRDTLVAGVRRQILFIFGAALTVLLIGAANVASLLVAQASGRRAELDTRIALGASRGRIFRQTTTEALLVAAIGGTGGLMLAHWAVPALLALAPTDIPRLQQVTVDARVLAFTIAVALAVGLVSGLTASVSLGHLNQPGGRLAGADAARRGHRVRRVIVVAEVALALLLVVAAGLMVRTVRAVGALPLGFDPGRAISVGLAPTFRSRVRVQAFEVEIVDRVRVLPGVVAAGLGSRPIDWGGMGITVQLPGVTEPVSWAVDAVSAGYLEALGGRLIAGRFLDRSDTASASKVVVINESAARLLPPDGGVVGRPLRVDTDVMDIVGLVEDVRRHGLEADPSPTLYIANTQTSIFSTNNLLIRTSGDPAAIVPAVRAIVRELDPTQVLTRVIRLEDILDQAKAPRRFTLALVGLFSGLALVLALIGICGVMAQIVAERVPEIGVRMALGATMTDVVSMVARQGAWMAAAGVAIGLAAARAMNSTMSTLVFGVTTTDTPTYALAASALVLAAIAACVIPAWRASRIDPVSALRSE